MNKENLEASKLEGPIVRITRARAKALGALGIPTQKPPQPEQKRVFQRAASDENKPLYTTAACSHNKRRAVVDQKPPRPEQRKNFQSKSKRAASDENKPLCTTAAYSHNKRRAVLADATNILGRKTHMACSNGSIFLKCQASKQTKKPNMRKSSKVAPVLLVESQHYDDVKDVAEDVSKLKVESENVTLPIKAIVGTGSVGSDVDHCEVTSSTHAEDNLKTHSSTCGSSQNTDLGPVERKFKWPWRLESLFKKDGKAEGKSETFVDPKIVDIDSNHDDPQMCSAYAPDIYSHICVTELNQRPSVDYMEKVQPDITQSMRGILIDWLVEVSEEYRLVPDTLYLTVNLIDRFLSQCYIEKQKLQLLGVTCMLIASKYEEISAPRVDEFCFITDNTYTREEMVKMERRVLNFLCFQLSVPTTKTFLRRFIRAAQATREEPSIDLEFIANYLAELTLVEYNFLKFLPSLVAASAVFLAGWTLDQSVHPWNPTLEYYTRYKPLELKATVLAMQDLQSNTKGCTLNAIRDKYRQKKFNSVASLSSSQPVQTIFTS